MTDKPKRTFVVAATATEHSEECVDIVEAKTPREAAVIGLNSDVFVYHEAVEVFEIGRGRRYVRHFSAKPAGKAE